MVTSSRLSAILKMAPFVLGFGSVSAFTIPSSVSTRPAHHVINTLPNNQFLQHDKSIPIAPTFSGLMRSSLSMSTNIQEESTVDPISQEIERVKKMDMNLVINTGIIVALSIAVLSRFATVDYGMMRGWTPAEMAVRIPVDNFLGYSSILNEAPVFTKAVTSATVYTIGDFISQRTEGKEIGDLDRGRIIRSLLAGLIGHGPLSHVWYDWSESIFNDVLHLTEWWSFAPKVAVDQLLWGPFWNNTYIILLGLMKLEKPGVIWSDIKRTTIPLVVSGLKLWPLAHCVTYGLVPVPYRLLWVDLVEILWVTILSTQAAGGDKEENVGH